MLPNRLRNLTIVVVEDDGDIRRYVSVFLAQFGAHVVEVENAFRGLEAIGTLLPDLALSDISMPRLDGFTLLRDIRALGPEAGGNVPVIAMTGLLTHAERGRFLKAGFQACLPKPFGPEKLLETILSVLNDS